MSILNCTALHCTLLYCMHLCYSVLHHILPHYTVWLHGLMVRWLGGWLADTLVRLLAG